MFGIDLGWAVAVVLGGIVAGKWLKKTDDKIEERRDMALQVADVLKEKGLSTTPELLRAYATGNYSKIFKALKTAAVTLTNPAAAAAEFDGIFEKMLVAKIADGTAKAELTARLTDKVVTAVVK